jgi:hypothetical protein
MAESMTYNSLVADIENYSERSDQPFLSQIPRFIMLAENRIASEIHGLGYLRFVEDILATDNPVVPKPARWRETASLFIVTDQGAVFLKQRSYTYCKSYWPDKSINGVPAYYCDYDYEHFLITATPDRDYAFELAYHERPTPLDDTNQTSWTTRYAPQLLLYATLLEAQPFLKLPERVAEFQALFDRASAAVTAEAQRRLGGDQALMRTTG